MSYLYSVVRLPWKMPRLPWKCHRVLYTHRWTRCPFRAEMEVFYCFVSLMCLCFTWDPLFTLALQFLYMLALCLVLELVGGIVALIFRNQVQSFYLFCFISFNVYFKFLLWLFACFQVTGDKKNYIYTVISVFYDH